MQGFPANLTPLKDRWIAADVSRMLPSQDAVAPSRLHALRSWLPAGDAISATEWARRHRVINALVWIHALIVPVYGILQDQAPWHAIAEAGVIVALALGAGSRRLSSTVRSVLATLGLVVASAVLTHISGGLIEMHFHFFVVVAVISLYQSWVPFLVALGFVVAHHGIGGQIAPGSVYNHPSAVSDAWRWALIHGGFILAESAACLVAWRLNEVALHNERHARAATEKANTDLAAAQAMSRIGSWEWNIVTGEVVWSDELYRLMGEDPTTFTPTIHSFLEHVHPDDLERVTALVAAAVDGAQLDFECRIARADGQIRVIHGRSDIATPEIAAERAIGTCQDITERKALEAEVEHRAFHDALTQLPNRALFLDRLDHGLALSKRTDAPLSLLYIDLDDFKTVNDNLGHDSGDDLLVLVARRLQGAVRSADTVSRLGGDEFAVLLEDTTAEGAAKVAAKLLDALIDPVDLHGSPVLTRASIGVAMAAPDDEPGDVLRHADIAMYAAKRNGKHSFRIFTDGMQSSLTARMELEAQLATAIEQEQLVVHYQPLVDLQTNEVDGVEALVRWDHPTRGLLPPSEFIGVAEETGLIVALGAWVLRRAAIDVRRLEEATGRPLYVSVNVAAPQLRTDLVTTVTEALAAAGLAADRLLLEITETCLVRQEDAVVPKLAKLRELGVRIAIDDFGTGYSSLSYLRQLPIDHLKIDRSFVRDITDGPEGSALAHSIIKLGSTFGLRIVGEGIENAAQADVLRRLGCHTGQGYLYYRPTDLESLLSSLPAAIVAPA